MDTSKPTDLQAYIEHLQRDYLVDSSPETVPLNSLLARLHWTRVRAVSRFWSLDSALHDIGSFVRRFLCGVWGTGIKFGYLVTGESSEVAVYLGEVLQQAPRTLAENSSTFLDQFRGFFPGMETGRAPRAWNLATNYVGTISGIPSVPEADDAVAEETPLNWIVRTMQGCSQWGYAVLTTPRPTCFPLQLLREAARRQREFSIVANRPVQWTAGMTVTPSGGYGEELVEIIKHHRERCRSATSTGMWQVQTVFFADTDLNRRRLGAALLSAFGGPQSQPQPLRIHYAHPNGNTDIKHYGTDLTSEELACLMTLPAVEIPGFQVKPYARFDVVPSPTKVPSMTIGQIVDANLPQVLSQDKMTAAVTKRGSASLSREFRIGRDELAQHALICGVTGSGKTNTCFVLLDGLTAGSKPLPFLVIEPAKTEYRALFGFHPVRVFTLGEERVAPFRLNPFWFDTSQGNYSTHIQTHIDHLKAVFNAAFVLYAPMPYVLEMCLHDIYQDKGWNLTISANTRVPSGQPVPPEAFPTLGDLHVKIGEVVDRLGYEQRVSMDIKAALQTRVGSLCLGAKGLMLNTRAVVSMKDLLLQPTVIEMEHIGSDEEKAFLMGLLLANLYAYRRAQARAAAAQGDSLPQLQHVTIIEEAHRLLARVPIEQSGEIANVRGHAVASFANMISEMRAFGEGIVIAEQIPTRLAADVVKNTNLKLMHCLLARDDRDVVGDAMVMDEEQKRFAATLRLGYAVAFRQGQDGPILIRVDKNPHTVRKGKVSDAEVKALPSALPTPLCKRACSSAQRDHCCDPRVRDRIVFALSEEVRCVFASLVIGALELPAWLATGLARLNQQLAHALTTERSGHEELWDCAVVHLSFEWFSRLGDGRRWPFDQVLQVASYFCTLTLDAWRDADSGDSPEWHTWRQRFISLCGLDIGPYPGCRYCPEPYRCRYREAVRHVGLTSSNLDMLLHALRQESLVDADQAGQEIREVCDRAAQEICDASPDIVRRLAVCFSSQAGAQYGFAVRQQEFLTEYIAHRGSEETSQDQTSG